MSNFRSIEAFSIGAYVKSGGSTEPRAKNKFHAADPAPDVSLPTVSILSSNIEITPADYHAGKAAQSAAEQRFPRRFLAGKLRKPSLKRTTPRSRGASQTGALGACKL